MGVFKIDATDFRWINSAEDDPHDLCLHGRAHVRIGERIFEDDAAISATALYLLKSLTEDHIIFEDNQMLPCCGFFIAPNESLDNVCIIGCDYGTDWTIKHHGDEVILVLEDGYEESIALDQYRNEVFAFADKIEAYYKICKPKILPKDEFDRNGYIAFWNEWNRRRHN